MNRRQTLLLFALFFLLLLPLLLWRDFTPSNELRYLSIVDEALENGNFFAFYNHGKPYADKPPLFFWLMMGLRSLLGRHCMLAYSLLSLLPAFGIIGVMNRWSDHYGKGSTVAGTIMVFACGFFLASALVIRMDMLMTLFIVLALWTLFKLDQRDGTKADLWLLPVYTFLAIFTKGAVGLLAPLVCGVVYLLLERIPWRKRLHKIGKFYGVRFWGVLLFLCGLWFIGVWLEGGSAYLNNLLFHQTLDRAVNSFHHKAPFYFYGISIWYCLAPVSLVCAVTFIDGMVHKRLQTNYARFMVTTALCFTVMMSLFSAKIAIYLLPALPFFLYGALDLMPYMKSKKWLQFSIALPAAIYVLALITYPFVQIYRVNPYHALLPSWELLLLLFAGGLLTLHFLFVAKNYLYASATLSGTLLVVLFVASFYIRKLNPEIGLEHIARQAQQEAVEHRIGQYGYYRLRGENMDVYLDKPLMEVTPENYQKLSNIIIFSKTSAIHKEGSVPSLLAKRHSYYKMGPYCYFIVE